MKTLQWTKANFFQLLACVENPEMVEYDSETLGTDPKTLPVEIKFTGVSDTKKWNQLLGWKAPEKETSLILQSVSLSNKKAGWERYNQKFKMYNDRLEAFLAKNSPTEEVPTTIEEAMEEDIKAHEERQAAKRITSADRYAPILELDERDSFNQHAARELILVIETLNAHGKSLAKKAVTGGKAPYRQAYVNKVVEISGWTSRQDVYVPTMKGLTGKTDEEWDAYHEEKNIVHTLERVKANIVNDKKELVSKMHWAAETLERDVVAIMDDINTVDAHNVPYHGSVSSLHTDIVSLCGEIKSASEQYSELSYIIRKLRNEEKEEDPIPVVPENVVEWINATFDKDLFEVKPYITFLNGRSKENQEVVIGKMLLPGEDEEPNWTAPDGTVIGRFWTYGLRKQMYRFRNAVMEVINSLIA